MAWALPARAAEEPEYRVDFRAGKVEVDTRLQRLELSDDVVIQVDRYRLLSDHLTLQRGPRGVEVEGRGRVAFCPCPDPPLSLTFDSATVAPPTDLLLENPTVYAGSVPVFWLPWFWLRAKNRMGLLPPRLSWRGDDGLLAGAGVHVPFGSDSDTQLDVFASGYLKGGAELEGRLAAPTSSTRVRWDHLNQSLLELDAHGSAGGRHAGSVAWRVDAIRGARGRRGTVELEPAARRFDRAELELSETVSGVVLAAGAQSVGRRAAPVDEVGEIGPRAHLGVSEALGAHGSVDLAGDVASFRESESRSSSAVSERAAIGFAPVLGPLSVDARLRHGLELSSTEVDSGLDSWGALDARVGLPLVRSFGAGPDPLRHRVEPFVNGGARAALHRGGRPAFDTLPAPDEPLLRVAAGLDTTLGRFAARDALRLTLLGGEVGPTEDLTALGSGRLIADTTLFGASVESTWDVDTTRQPTTLARLRLGRPDDVHVSGHVESRGDVEPVLARWLSADDFSEPPLGWLSDSGVSAGGEIGVTWTRWLASSVGSEHDLSARKLLAVRGSIGYRHPCGCLAVLAWAGKRVGRGGADAWLSLDLMP